MAAQMIALRKISYINILLMIVTLMLGYCETASAVTYIQEWMIQPVDNTLSGTGSGANNRSWSAFTQSGTDTGNGTFDSANTLLPGPVKDDAGGFELSFWTSALDLKNFYNESFGYTQAGEVDLALFLDLKENPAGAQTNILTGFDVWLNPTIPGTTSPYNYDTSSAEQNALPTSNLSAYGGELLTTLDSSIASGYNMPIIDSDPAFPDYSVTTGLDPFSFADDDVLLFNLSMTNLGGPSDEWYISSLYSPNEVTFTPEPATNVLLGFGLIGLYLFRRKFRNS